MRHDPMPLDDTQPSLAYTIDDLDDLVVMMSVDPDLTGWDAMIDMLVPPAEREARLPAERQPGGLITYPTPSEKPGHRATVLLAEVTIDERTLRALADNSFRDVLRAVAGNPATPVDVLRDLLTKPDCWARSSAAAHPAMGDDLELLTFSSDEFIRGGVLVNPHTPDHVLAWLVADPSPVVRRCVASHSRTTQQLLAQLADDPDDAVRYHVAKNPSTSADTVTHLAEDPDPWVRAAVVDNHRVSPGVITALAADQDGRVRTAVAARATTPAAILTALASDPTETVRVAVAANLTTPTHLLEQLA